MSAFYTAPPIYNTGGWGWKGDLPTFDPTGIFTATPNSGIARSFVGVIDYKANVPSKSTESTAASKLLYGLRYTKGKNTVGPNLQYPLSYIKVKNIPNLNLNYSFGEGRDVKSSFNTDVNYFSTVLKALVSKSETEANYFSSSKNYKALVNREIGISHVANSKLKGRLQNTNNTEINNFAASIARRLRSYSNIEPNLFPASITRRLYYSTNVELNLFPASITRRASGESVPEIEYFIDGNPKDILSIRDISGTSSFYSKFHKEAISDREIILNSIRNGSHRLKSDREVILYNVRNGSHRFKNERSAEANLFSASISRRAMFNKELGTEYYRKALWENFLTRSINLQYNLHFSKFKNTTKSNISYFSKDVYEGVSRFSNKINSTNYSRRDTGKFKNNKNISTIKYYNTDFNRGSFTKDDSLNLINYNIDSAPNEGKTKSSFPTGVDFPKIRYQSVEPDYSKQSTGSATYGVLTYEGVADGNLFYYEPDQDSFKWQYFDYGVRSGIFDPCEFPETADRTLDPIQISSKSNKKDNPFWYLPDLLTVDSTIHTADGAPCQYIAQENSRYAAIYMEPVYAVPGDPSSAISQVDVLHPENFTQPGVAFTV